MAPPTRRRPSFARLLPPSLFLLLLLLALLLLLLLDPATAIAATSVAETAARRGDVGAASLSAPSRWLLSKARRGGAIGSGESRGSGSWEQDLKVR